MSKKHISIWIDQELLQKSDDNKKKVTVNSRSDYIAKALEYYNKSLEMNEFAKENVMKPIDTIMKRFEDRMAKQLFKQSVESAKLFWLMVHGLDLEPGSVDLLHEDCVKEVKRINGAIRFPYNSNNTDED